MMSVDWKIIIFILAGLLLLWIISKNYPWTKAAGCIVDISVKEGMERYKAPIPIFSSPVENLPWSTNNVNVEWDCDFDHKSYHPEQIYFRVNTVMEGVYNDVQLYTYEDVTMGNTGEIYHYGFTRHSQGDKYKSGTYSIYITAYVNDKRINPNPTVKVNPETSSTNLLKIVIGDCKPLCKGRQCGPDGCGVLDGCGSCDEGYECQDGRCVCVPDCTEKACGDDDGCGGICEGTCPEGYECESGQCVATGPCSVEGSPCEGPGGIPGTYYCKQGKCTKCPACSGSQGCPDACTICQKFSCPFGYGCTDKGICKKCPRCGDCPEGCKNCRANCTGNTDTCVDGKCKCGQSGKSCKGTSDTCTNGQCYCGTGPECDSSQKCINGECKNLCCYVSIWGNLCCSKNGRCDLGVQAYDCNDCGGSCS